MVTLTADDAMVAALSQAVDQAEIRDRAGRLVGFFTPIWEVDESIYEKVKPNISPEELQRRPEESGPCLTTRQVFEHLLALTTDPATRAHLQKMIEVVAARDACDSR